MWGLGPALCKQIFKKKKKVRVITKSSLRLWKQIPYFFISPLPICASACCQQRSELPFSTTKKGSHKTGADGLAENL